MKDAISIPRLGTPKNKAPRVAFKLLLSTSSPCFSCTKSCAAISSYKSGDAKVGGWDLLDH